MKNMIFYIRKEKKMDTEKTNEKIIEEAIEMPEVIRDEVIKYNPNKSLKVMIGTGLVIATGAVAYRFAIKPLVGRVKSKIVNKKEKADEFESDDAIDISEEIETTEE